jgi:hypothetical protein
MYTFSLPLEVLMDPTLLGLGLRGKQVLGSERTSLTPKGGGGGVLGNSSNCPGVFTQGRDGDGLSRSDRLRYCQTVATRACHALQVSLLAANPKQVTLDAPEF